MVVFLLRDVAVEYYARHPVVIGGPNTIVEIDETCVTRRKYERGRLVRQNQWLFGGVQRGTNGTKCFVVPVERRDANTLLPLIRQHIRAGTTIYSDGWAAYNTIGNQQNMNYTHDRVIHEYNFLNPQNPLIHTQSIENMWSQFKKTHLKRPNGINISSDLFSNYMVDYVWRHNFRQNTFYHLWHQISEMYPCEH